MSSRPTTPSTTGSSVSAAASILLGGIDNEPPLVFNRIAIGFRFDTDHKRCC